MNQKSKHHKHPRLDQRPIIYNYRESDKRDHRKRTLVTYESLISAPLSSRKYDQGPKVIYNNNNQQLGNLEQKSAPNSLAISGFIDHTSLLLDHFIDAVSYQTNSPRIKD